jgi:hypothetical protein
MTFGAFALWQQTASSTDPKIWLVVPVALACTVTTLKALVDKTDLSTRLGAAANMITFAAFHLVLMTAARIRF